MRPRKRVLCISPCEFRLSRLVFVLETRGYRALRAESSEQALQILEAALPGTIDVLVCELFLPTMDGNELTRRAKELHLGLPSLLVCETVDEFPQELWADIFLGKRANTPAELLERVRILAARKRGPKKNLLPAAYVPQMADREAVLAEGVL